MITARNYAAQLEKEIKNNKVLFLDDSIRNHIANLVKTSEHFALPDDGIILNDGYKGLHGNSLKLPYKCMTVEYYAPSSNYGKDKINIEINNKTYTSISLDKKIVLAIENKNEIMLLPFLHTAIYNVWVFSKVCIKFNQGVLFNEKTAYIHSHAKDLSEEHLEIFKLQADQAVQPFLEMLEALTCRNVYIESLEPVDKKKNERRIKDGKVPFYETKILVVNSKSKEVDKTHKGGTHASPKQHLRRGHIRRLPKGNIWINNCVVGKIENGFVDKYYNVI